MSTAELYLKLEPWICLVVFAGFFLFRDLLNNMSMKGIIVFFLLIEIVPWIRYFITNQGLDWTIALTLTLAVTLVLWGATILIIMLHNKSTRR